MMAEKLIQTEWRAETRCQPKLDIDRYVSAVAMVESSGRTNAVGDGGKAVGLHQFHKGTWDMVSRIRRHEGRSTASFNAASIAEWSTAYCVTLTLWNRTRFQAATGRNPSVCDLYAMHNLGFDGYRSRGFRLESCPGITKKACSRIKQLCGEKSKSKNNDQNNKNGNNQRQKLPLSCR